MSQHIIGRTADLFQLRAVVDAAARGHGSLVLLSGEPGIGKTRLAEEAAGHARDAGFAVHWASCWEGDGAPAYWPWMQMLRAHAVELDDATLASDAGADTAELVLLVPGLAQRLDVAAPPADDGSEHERFRLFDAVATLLKRASVRTPMLLVIDDLHWADVGSLLLLRFLAQQLRTMRTAVIANLRDVELDPNDATYEALTALQQQSRTIPLLGLTHQDVAELISSILGHEGDETMVRTVHHRTAGNPLFVLEVARLAAAAPGAPVGIPEGVRAVLGRRLARLTSACLDVLEAAAVLGAEFRIDVLSRVLNVDQLHVLEVLSEAERARLVRESGPARFAFTHALVRDVLYAGLPPARRSALHHDVGGILDVLAASEADPNLAQIAHHFLRAGTPVDAAKGVEYAERAGRRALEQLGYEDAVRLFTRALEALELCEPDEGRRTALLLALGDAQLRSGDVRGARQTFDAAADLARRRSDAHALTQAALGFSSGLGGFEVRMEDRHQLDLLEEALESVGPDDSSERAWIMARLSVALSMVESTERRHELAADAIEMTRRLGDDRALAHALAAHCDAIAGPDDCRTRLAEADEIIRLSVRVRDRGMELLGRRHRVAALMELGDFASVDTEVDLYEATADDLRQPLYSWYVLLWRGTRAQMRGHLDEAEALTVEAERVGALASSTNAAMLVIVQRWMTAHILGRPEGIAEVLRTFSDLFAGGGFVPYLAVVDAWAQAAAGDLDRAQATLAPVLADGSPFGKDAEFLPTMFQIAEYVRHTRDTRVAEMLFDELRGYGDLFGIEGIGAGCWGPVDRALGVAASVLERYDDAFEHFDRASRAAERVGSPPLVADVLRDHGAALRQRDLGDDRVRGERMLARATETYRSIGAEPAHDAEQPPNALHPEGDYWTLTYAELTVRVKDVKGIHDIAALLAAQGREIHALDLAGGRSSRRPADAEADLHEPGHAGEVLDDAARDAYRAHIAELEEEIAEAEAFSDGARAERARAEHDQIAEQLGTAYGLGGRKRRSGDPAERARSAVTQRIRDALHRIDQVHPEAAKHLRHSIRTGTYCSYAPEQPTSWVLTP